MSDPRSNPPSKSGSSAGGAPGRAAALRDASRGSTSADDPTRISGSGPVFGGDLAAAQSMVPGYELIEELHRGGQGVVYRAVQLGTKRPVALKVLLEGPFASEATRRRFEREIELAASLRHPHIVGILDSGISHGRYFFAMELIDGLRLDHYLRRHTPPLPQVLTLLAEVAEAVNFAHQRGVIHRDLKPSNILVDAEGHPHVLDFGLAKEQRSADPGDTTLAVVSTTGQVIGTIAYMSPEQAAGSTDIDVRSDVYTLGVLCYESLLGRPPYQVTGALGDVLQRIVHEDPLRPRSVRSESRFGRLIDDELETILLRALEKDPARRYQTAGELARDLRHYLAGEPVEAKRASGFYMLRKTLRRYRVQAGVAGLLLMMLIGFVLVLAAMYTRERDARYKIEQLSDALRREAAVAQAAADAEAEARRDAERTSFLLEAATVDLKQALVRQRVQRGNLALAQNDLFEARDSFWEALGGEVEDAGALWALRRYYLETGDDGAWALTFAPAGLAGFSLDGSKVVTCEASRAVSVRDAASGAVLAWFPTPQDVHAVSIGDDGTVAVAGPNWAGLWRVGDPAPIAVLDLPDVPAALQVFAWQGQVVIVDERRAWLLRTGPDAPAKRWDLRAAATSAPRLLARRGLLAVPTSAGIEVIELAGPAGADSPKLAYAGPARDVCLLDDGRLAVLADALDVVDSQGGEWRVVGRILSDTRGWDLLDVRRGDGPIVLGRRSGEVAVHRAGRAPETRSVTKGALLALRLSRDGGGVLTLDRRGVLTRWSPMAERNRHRLVHDRPPTAWAVSADASCVSLIDADGRIATYSVQGERGAVVRRSRLPALVNLLPGSDISDVGLALSGDGGRLALRVGSRVWVEAPGRPRSQALDWAHPKAPLLARMAMNSDGNRLALYARSPAGDEQIIYFAQLTRRGLFPRPVATGLPAPAAPSVRLMGSAVRDMLFLPGSNDLLVARSSGELLLLPDAALPQPSAPAVLIEGARAPAAWAQLDSPPTRMAIDAHGRWLAVACEDGTVRVLSVLDTSEKGRISQGAAASALGFNARADVLSVRSVDGALTLYEVETLDRLARWTFADGSGAPMAAWAGGGDTLLLSERGAVYEYDYGVADPLIALNRPFGQEREIARKLSDNQPYAAWQAAERLAAQDEARGRAARLAIACAMLRTPGRAVRPEWIERLRQPASAHELLRLGHAAYAGGHYELARELLASGAQRLESRIDSVTQWRLAECAYVLDEPGAAADLLTRLLDAPGLSVPDMARLRLELIAAHYLSGREEQAQAVLRSLDRLGHLGERGSAVDQVAAIVVGSYLLGQAEQSQWTATLQALLSQFRERWLAYRDDIEFFAGERARKAGDLEAARQQYQLCIDLASDGWPSPWARHRLRQLSNTAP